MPGVKGRKDLPSTGENHLRRRLTIRRLMALILLIAVTLGLTLPGIEVYRTRPDMALKVGNRVAYNFDSDQEERLEKIQVHPADARAARNKPAEGNAPGSFRPERGNDKPAQGNAWELNGLCV
jgi:hypothetical protein